MTAQEILETVATNTDKPWNEVYAHAQRQLFEACMEIIGEDEPEHIISGPYKLNPKSNTSGAGAVTTYIENKGYSWRNSLRGRQRAELRKFFNQPEEKS